MYFLKASGRLNVTTKVCMSCDLCSIYELGGLKHNYF